jgi:hypothetical protein
MNFNDFSYSVYKKLLKSLLNSRSNLCFRDFAKKGEIDRSYFILRHDIDFSPGAALRMAELEANLDVKATYFILFSSSFYNLFCEEYIEFPRKLIELGHEVGLHYDVKSMEMASHNIDLIDMLYKQIDFLSCLTGTEIESIAVHNPSVSDVDPFRETEFVNAYDKRYTKQITYFSDSCAAWRDDFVEHFKKNNLPDKIQLLIHPIFWDLSSFSRWEILDNLTHTKYSRLLKDVKIVKQIWKNHTGVIEHDRRNMLSTNS